MGTLFAAWSLAARAATTPKHALAKSAWVVATGFVVVFARVKLIAAVQTETQVPARRNSFQFEERDGFLSVRLVQDRQVSVLAF